MFILFPIWGSIVWPKAVAYFVIAFLVYWIFRSFKSSFLALVGYFQIKKSESTNWLSKFKEDFRGYWTRYKDICHVVLVVSYKEPIEVMEMAMGSLAAQTDIDTKKLYVVLAQEERAGKENNQNTIDYFTKKYANKFGWLGSIEHPFGILGEVAGKHTNEAWAAKEFKKKFIDSGNLKMENCTLTSCDVDTIFHPKYFSALTYHFAANQNRYFRFWQSPIFWHHNINAVPAPIRIIGTLGNIVHVANIQEPDGLFFNYSCYSSSYKLIDSANYWDPDMIPEDWHIFLQTFFANEGKVLVEPIFLPTVVDAPDGPSYFQALKNRYSQCLRHAWGAVDIRYAISQSIKHPEIPLITRLLRLFKLLETHIIWSSNWFILTLGTSVPVLLNPNFFQTSIGYNLPKISNIILTVCLIPLLTLIILDWKLRPAAQKRGFGVFLKNLLQWPLMPLATLALSVLPGLHSHTRLMLGQSLEYKTTVKKSRIDYEN